MASSRAGAVGPQFFITLGDVAFLETSGLYDQLGKISSGMEVVDKIQIGDKMTSIDITVA